MYCTKQNHKVLSFLADVHTELSTPVTVQENELERNLKQLQNNYTLTLLLLIKVTKSSTGSVLFFTFSPITSIYVEKRLIGVTLLCEQYYILASSINCDSKPCLQPKIPYEQQNWFCSFLFVNWGQSCLVSI